MTFQVGIELEILAPQGSSRATLAERVARSIGGSVVGNWHLDTEPSAHPDLDVFHHLTPAFDVLDNDGNLFVRMVSDVTIHADLDIKAPGLAGWHRVLSDDPRFLRMVGQFLPSMEASSADLDALADRLGLLIEQKGETTRLHDSTGASVVMFTTLPGEKHRVTECISPPLTDGFDNWLTAVVGAANEIGFSVPSEGATHLHYDAPLFREPEAFRRLVYAFGPNVDVIRQKMETNPRCRRIGALPTGLVDFAESDRYGSMEWSDIVAEAAVVDGLTTVTSTSCISSPTNPNTTRSSFGCCRHRLTWISSDRCELMLTPWFDTSLTRRTDRRRHSHRDWPRPLVLPGGSVIPRCPNSMPSPWPLSTWPVHWRFTKPSDSSWPTAARMRTSHRCV